MSDIYLIWSNEHRAWWGPARSGYETHAENAGQYSQREAVEICADAMPGTFARLGMPPELPVRVEDVKIMFALFREAYPGHDPEPER
jgi:hypothetical protein